jgi:hypothetical protein
MGCSVFRNWDEWLVFILHMEHSKVYIYQNISNLKYTCIACFSEHYIKLWNSDRFQGPRNRSVIHMNLTSLTSFSRYKAVLSSCEIWDEVCYLSHEKIHVQQKSDTFHGGWSILFEKAVFKTFGSFLVFWPERTLVLMWIEFKRQSNQCKTLSSFIHIVYTHQKKKKSQARAVAEFRSLRSSLALGIETQAREMVSSKFYWVIETM